MVSVEPTTNRFASTPLLPEEALRLDALLMQDDIYAQRVEVGRPSIGAFVWTMEIVTPGRTRQASWSGPLPESLGAIVDVILGPQ
jgi:hypothetical protein